MLKKFYFPIDVSVFTCSQENYFLQPQAMNYKILTMTERLNDRYNKDCLQTKSVPSVLKYMLKKLSVKFEINKFH